MAGYMKWHTDYTHVYGPSIVGGFAFNMDRHFAFREAPSLPYLDLDYCDVTGNSAKIIPEVYRKIGAPLTETVLGAMQQRSEEHTSELQSLMRSSYAVFCLKIENTLFYTQVSKSHYLFFIRH